MALLGPRKSEHSRNIQSDENAHFFAGEPLEAFQNATTLRWT
jgi:hypothetical protein